MKLLNVPGGRRLSLVWLLGLMLAALADRPAAAAEQELPLLKTKTATFTNVTVTTKNKAYVFILHAGGMASIKLGDLSPEALEELGYVDPAKKKSQPTTVLARQIVPKIQNQLKPIEREFKKQVAWNREHLKLPHWIFYAALAVGLLMYLFSCYCCHLILIKSRKPASILSWLPGLQLFSLLRAADMSGWWFLAFCVPVLNIVASILWAVNICKVREKGTLLVVLLILPVTSCLAFLYLAFSSEVEEREEPKYKSMSLQTA